MKDDCAVPQMLPDRLAQDIQSCLGDQLFLAGAPQLLIDEIVINTSEPDAVATKDIASFHAVTELAIEEELVAIRKQLAAVAVLLVKIALHPFRNPAQWDVLFLVAAQSLATSKRLLQELHGLNERIIRCRRRKLDALKNGAEIDLEALRGFVFVEMLPFERLLIEARVSGQVFGHGIHPCRVQYSKGFPPHIFERQSEERRVGK